MFSNLSLNSMCLATVTPSFHFLGGASQPLAEDLAAADLGNLRRAVGLLERNVAALGAQRHLHGVGEFVHPNQEAAACIHAKLDVFGETALSFNRAARVSLWLRVRWITHGVLGCNTASGARKHSTVLSALATSAPHGLRSSTQRTAERPCTVGGSHLPGKRMGLFGW